MGAFFHFKFSAFCDHLSSRMIYQDRFQSYSCLVYGLQCASL